MADPLVHHRQFSGVAEIVLARPEAGNAMSLALMQDLEVAVEAAAADPRTRAILLWGEGRNFCVGGDIRSFAEQTGAAVLMRELAATLHRAVARLAEQPAPVVVAAQGASAGAGLSLVAGADIAIAARGASFSMAYASLGLTADGGASWFLPRLIGLRRTQDLALSARRLSAAEAAQWGLVTRVVDEEALLGEARAEAARLAEGPTGAYRAIRRLLARQGAETLGGQLDAELEAIVEARGRPDAQAGVAAFLARERPRFTGG